MKYLLISVAVLYLFFSIKYQAKIVRTPIFSFNQKIINSILLWIIPFIWGIVLDGVLKPVPGSIKSKRQKNSGHRLDSAGPAGMEAAASDI